MYNKGLNIYLEKNYPSVRKFTSKINYFYDHINSITNNISYILDQNCYLDETNFNLNCFKRFESIKSTISVVVMCKNEERCIERCVSSIINALDTNDELIVLDTGSNDETLNILEREFPSVVIIKEKWNNDFGSMRNIGIDKAKNEWVFFIDADEILDSNSMEPLKLYLKVIDFMELKNVVINPIIVNKNSHIVQGVRRIIKKSDRIRYYGLIHEEPRLDKNMYGKDVDSISFDNVILYHDGYTKKVMNEKNKYIRNTELLKKMMMLEPEYPRWTYFYCRDGKNLISEEDYEKYLNQVISLCQDDKYYEEYKIRALSNLIEQYLINGSVDEAEKKLSELKEICPDLSDVFYFDTYIQLVKIKYNCHLLLKKAISYRQSRNNIEFGSIHSNYFHIDYLIAKLFFEVGEYQRSFNILKKLEKNEFKDYREDYRQLYHSLNKYFDNVNYK